MWLHLVVCLVAACLGAGLAETEKQFAWSQETGDQDAGDQDAGYQETGKHDSNNADGEAADPDAAGAGPSQAADPFRSTVGMPARIEQLVLPGGELEVVPLEDENSPIVLRITGIFPHGTNFRYDFEYYGLEAGQFDLRDFLRRQDRSSLDDLPPLLVTIESVLPPGQVKPNQLAARGSPFLGGYWLTLTVAGLVWLVGLVAIIWWMAAGRAGGVSADGSAPPATLAERLRPIVQDAIAGQSSEPQLAALERMLIAFWRKRLNLDDASAADAMAALRRHDEASVLLEQLEVWLHRPGDAGSVNIAELLKPYQDLPADALES